MRRVSYENADERNFKYPMEIRSFMELYESIKFCFVSHYCSGKYCAFSKDGRWYLTVITGKSCFVYSKYVFDNIYSCYLFGNAFDELWSLSGNPFWYANNGSAGKRDCTKIQKTGLQMLWRAADLWYHFENLTKSRWKNQNDLLETVWNA